MKKFFLIILLCAAYSLNAQSKITGKLPSFKTGPSIKMDIAKVARDIYQEFNNVKGDTLLQSGHFITFSSKIIPPGAKDCFVTRHAYPNSFSWQATMFTGEVFEEAVAKYKSYYKQLSGAPVTFYDKATYKLQGEYDVPDEGRAFASSLLQLTDATEALQSLKVEIGLNYTFPEWAVTILIYEKVADKEIRPSAPVSTLKTK